MAKPSLDDLIDSVRKGPAPDPKKVAAEKKKKERKEALKNVPVAKKKSRAQKDKESADSFISTAKKSVSDARNRQLDREKKEDTLASRTRKRELGDKKKSLENKKAASDERKQKAGEALASAKTSTVSSKDSNAEATGKIVGNALSTVGAGLRAGAARVGASEKASRLKKKMVQKMRKNRGLKTGVASKQDIKNRSPKKKQEKEKDPWNESMDWRDSYIPTEIETMDVIKPEPLKASNWKEDFIWEVEDYPKEKKEKQLKPMTGKNTVIINPKIDEGIRLKTKAEYMQGLNKAKERIGNWWNKFVPPAKDSNEPSVRSGERTPNTGGVTQPHIPSRGRDGKRYGSEDDGSVAPPKSTEKDTRTPEQKTTPADRAKQKPTPTPAPTPTPKPKPKPPTAREKAYGPKSTLSAKDQATNREYDRLRRQPGGTKPGSAAEKFGKAASKAKFGDQLKPKTPNPLMRGMPKRPKINTPVKLTPTPAQGSTPTPAKKSGFSTPKPMRLTNSFSDWRGELQLDEVLGGKPGDGYIGHPRLDIKNPLHKGPRKKAETGGAGISHRMGDRNLRLDKMREEVNEGAAWTKKEGKNSAGGLNEKGRKSYEKENPGSDLKAPSKKVGNPRRASFCARMKGMKKKLTSKKTASDPDSRINKSLRAWNC